MPRRSADPAAPFVAARAVGAPAARALWLILWASLAYFALLPANRAPQGLHAMLSGMTEGEPPGWPRSASMARRSWPTRGWPPRPCWPPSWP